MHSIISSKWQPYAIIWLTFGLTYFVIGPVVQVFFPMPLIVSAYVYQKQCRAQAEEMGKQKAAERGREKAELERTIRAAKEQEFNLKVAPYSRRDGDTFREEWINKAVAEALNPRPAAPRRSASTKSAAPPVRRPLNRPPVRNARDTSWMEAGRNPSRKSRQGAGRIARADYYDDTSNLVPQITALDTGYRTGSSAAFASAVCVSSNSSSRSSHDCGSSHHSSGYIPHSSPAPNCGLNSDNWSGGANDGWGCSSRDTSSNSSYDNSSYTSCD